MNNSVPWVDKYRPKKLGEIISQEEVTKVLSQTLITGQMPHLLFYGSSGTGKCMALNTPIIMYDGSIKMVQDVKENDLLMGDDDTARMVLSLAKGRDIMYEIIQCNGDNYTVNSEHIISLKLSSTFLEKWDEEKQKYRLYWFENHEEHRKSFYVQLVNKQQIQKISYLTKENAYDALTNFKQYISNESNFNKKGNICDISIKDYLKKSNEWKSVYKGFKCNKITCWKKKEVDFDPYMFGCWLGSGETSHMQRDNVLSKSEITIDHKNIDYHNEHIPHDYKINDIDTRLQLLAGFLDANENLSENGDFEFNQKSKKVFDDIVFIARSLGFMVSIGKSIIINNIVYHRASIHGYGIEKIPLRKKNTVCYRHDRSILTYEIKVKKLSEDDYYGFEIDGNKRFLLGDFTVTHNTSTILAVAYQLFGPKVFKERVMELNASDERGINIVRHKINTFARTAIGNIDKSYPCPPFKLIILDEADAMTTEAQSALRKVMEELSSITRFCFICNYKNQIIDPIVSRCMKFRFKPIDSIYLCQKLNDIAIKENMNICNIGLQTISNIAKGDVRKGIMILQNLKYIEKYKKIDTSDIYKITGQISIDLVIPIWNACNDETTTLDAIITKIDIFRKNAIPVMSILENLQQILIDSDMDDRKKSLISIHLSEAETCIYGGANEYLQLMGIFSYIYAINKYNSETIVNNIC